MEGPFLLAKCRGDSLNRVNVHVTGRHLAVTLGGAANRRSPVGDGDGLSEVVIAGELSDQEWRGPRG